MKVNPVKTNRISFGEALNSKQLEEYTEVFRRSNELLRTAEGKKVLIVHDSSLPQKINTGVGNITDEKAFDFFTLMRNYLGINAVEVLPQGEYSIYNSRVNPYKGSSLSLGQQLINLEALTTEQFGKILDLEDVETLAKNNTLPNKSTFINYENILSPESSFGALIEKAFGRFKQADGISDLKQEFSAFKTENADWITPKVIFSRLTSKHGWNWKKWDDVDRNLYNQNTPETAKRLAQLSEECREDFDLYSFKQFLAKKHLQLGKQKLNDMGLDLIGDCLMGVTPDEVWANQKAFSKFLIGKSSWGLNAVDFTKLYNNDGTLGEAGKFLKKKFSAFFKNYDGVRFDVGWAYVQPHLSHGDEKIYITESKNYLGDEVLKFIERVAKEIKGENFDLRKLMYETETSGNDFRAFNYCTQTTGTVIPPLKNRMQIYTTMWKKDDWGSIAHFKNNLKLDDDEFILGVGNHDSIPLKGLANGVLSEGVELRTQQYGQLAKFLKIQQELIKDPVEFAKAKFAEIFCAKNQMYFFNDIFGSDDVFDSHGLNNASHRLRIPENFEEIYHAALQEGYGLNPMDALQKAFVAKGLDKSQPELFEKISEFNRILAKKGVKTQKEADALISSNMAKFKQIKSKLAVPLFVGVSFFVAGVTAYLAFKRKKELKMSEVSYNLQINVNQNEKNAFTPFLNAPVRRA